MTKANGRGLDWRWEAPEERFLRFIDKSGGAVACWPWTGTKAPNGYGQFRLSRPRRKIIAHRYAWILFRGEVFITGGKSGEQVEAIARDGAVLLSLALQHGVALETISHAITRDSQGAPSSIVGAVVDKLRG